MDAKTSEWRPGPSVCRCCLTEGCYKDISTEYFWMGKREVYAEMLSETLNVSISYSQAGGPNSNSRLICEPCISRLRDASDFRRQVVECEKSFMQHLDPCSSMADIEVNLEPLGDGVKLECVKLEKSLSDDDYDDRCDFPDDDDDDDDLDDQPLTKLASRIPKKETVDIIDIPNTTKSAEKRKSTTKIKLTPVKKTKVVKIEPMKAGVSKMPTKVAGKLSTKVGGKAASKTTQKTTEKKKKELDPLFEARQNAKLLLKYSTAYPFRIPSNDMVCVYCCEAYSDPREYREHMRLEHPVFSITTAFAHTMSSEEYLKVDCTELECRLCDKKFDNVQTVATHLIGMHNKKVNLNYEIGVQVFKLGQERWVCAICGLKYPCLRALSRHNSAHYHKYTCETCGKSYISRENLNKHIFFGHSQEKICIKCKESFPNCEARRQHVLATKRCWPFSCSVCAERFVSRKLKTDHMSEVHRQKQLKFHSCPECGKTFNEWRMYRSHFIISHTNNNYECSFCGAKFDNKRGLEDHKVIHTKEKLFPCTVCTKSFVRKKNLIQHLWIHSEHKRFECRLCNKQFNQRVSWKTHMRSYHPELVDFD